jgi:hypothetical protein
MNREQRIIASLRTAIAAKDSDPDLAGQQQAAAQELFCKHRFSRKFFDLYWALQKIINAASPKEAGHYRTTHIGIGYSSFPIQRWVPDRNQPEPPPTEELLRRFDQCIEIYRKGNERR